MHPFFGGSTIESIKNDDYYQSTHELPDAYVGRNKFLMSTLDYLITKDGRDFLTKVILPFEHTDNTNVAWEIFHFDRSLADVEPELGVPRYVTMHQEVNSDRLVRRGLAFQIEHGFYQTDVGRRHYMMNIQQIVEAVADTTAMQVITALLDTELYYVPRESINSDPRDSHLVKQMSRFGIIQRGEAGFHMLDSELKDDMLRHNIRPNTYILPPRSTTYISMRDPYMREYSRGGRGVAALEGPDEVGLQSISFRGTRVYEARYFETDFHDEPFDPLTQTITYGEYYLDESTTTPGVFTYGVRPSIQYEASTAILCTAGSELGVTMTGHHDFQLSDDVLHKVHIGHYTFYSIAVVKQPKLMHRAEGVFCRKYLSGEGDEECIKVTVRHRVTGPVFLLQPKKYAQFRNNHEQRAKLNMCYQVYSDAIAANPDALNEIIEACEQTGLRTLFSPHSADNHTGKLSELLVPGTRFLDPRTPYINQYGFGPMSYPGCRSGREGKGPILSEDKRNAYFKSISGSDLRLANVARIMRGGRSVLAGLTPDVRARMGMAGARVAGAVGAELGGAMGGGRPDD